MSITGYCSSHGCDAPADTAIRTTAPPGKAMVHTIWQDPLDAPKRVPRYCVVHGMHLARELTRLSAVDVAAAHETRVNLGEHFTDNDSFKDR